MKRRTGWEAVAVIALLIFIAAIVSAVVNVVWFPGAPFDSTVWQNANRWDSTVRYPMASRLVAQRSLIGKSRAEVLELLGAPDRYTDPNGPELWYYADSYSAIFNRNNRYLVVRFGPDDTVVEVKLDLF